MLSCDTVVRTGFDTGGIERRPTQPAVPVEKDAVFLASVSRPPRLCKNPGQIWLETGQILLSQVK